MSETKEKSRFDDYGKSVLREIRPYLFNSYPYIITGFRLYDENPMEEMQVYEISIKCTKCDFEWMFRILKNRKDKINPFHDGMMITKLFYEQHYTHVEPKN